MPFLVLTCFCFFVYLLFLVFDLQFTIAINIKSSYIIKHLRTECNFIICYSVLAANINFRKKKNVFCALAFIIEYTREWCSLEGGRNKKISLGNDKTVGMYSFIYHLQRLLLFKRPKEKQFIHELVMHILHVDYKFEASFIHINHLTRCESKRTRCVCSLKMSTESEITHVSTTERWILCSIFTLVKIDRGREPRKRKCVLKKQKKN